MRGVDDPLAPRSHPPYMPVASRMHDPEARAKLVSTLRAAYSGELAAAHAYAGHWRSSRNAEERARIRRIEEEERHHRSVVGDMLRELGAGPRRALEVRAFLIGKWLGLLCRGVGWFLPMYAAGKLESRNVKEYEYAARNAALAGRPELVECLLAMAEVERAHEAYFRAQVLGHPWLSVFPLWPATSTDGVEPPPFE